MATSLAQFATRDAVSGRDSALHHHERPELRDPARDPSAIDDVDDVDDVLVGPRHLFRDPAERLRADDNAAAPELSDEIEATPGLLRLRAAHHAAGAVAARAERLGHGAPGAEEEERLPSHS